MVKEEIKTTGEVSETTGGVSETTGGVNETTGGVNETTGGVNETTGEINETTGEINETIIEVTKNTTITDLSEIQSFIEQFQFSLNGNGEVILPESLKNRIGNAEENYEELNKRGKQIENLYNTIKHYLTGINELTEKTKNPDKETFFGKYSKLFKRKIRSIPKIGESAVELLGGIDDIVNRDVMKELGEGGLTKLMEDAEEAMNSVAEHHKALLKNTEEIKKHIKEKKEELAQINIFLGKNLDENEILELQKIKQSIEEELALSMAQLNLSNQAIQIYKINIVHLIEKLPKSLNALANIVNTYGISEVSKNTGEINEDLQELTEEATMLPFHIVKKSSKELNERLDKDTSAIPAELLGIIKNIDENNKGIQEKLEKDDNTLKNNPLLEELKQLNEEYTDNSGPKLLK